MKIAFFFVLENNKYIFLINSLSYWFSSTYCIVRNVVSIIISSGSNKSERTGGKKKKRVLQKTTITLEQFWASIDHSEVYKVSAVSAGVILKHYFLPDRAGSPELKMECSMTRGCWHHTVETKELSFPSLQCSITSA